jgi:hypothetical protein
MLATVDLLGLPVAIFESIAYLVLQMAGETFRQPPVCNSCQAACGGRLTWWTPMPPGPVGRCLCPLGGKAGACACFQPRAASLRDLVQGGKQSTFRLDESVLLGPVLTLAVVSCSFDEISLLIR